MFKHYRWTICKIRKRNNWVYQKEIPVPFKIYADFECNLKNVGIYEGHYSKKYQKHNSCSSAYRVVCIDDIFTRPIVVFRGKTGASEFIKAILKEYEHCKRIMKK